MTRFLLTLLALLTGLVATGTPASARICIGGGTEVGSVSGSLDGVRDADRGQSTAAPSERQSGRVQKRNCLRLQRKPVYIPTVQLGVDRALE